MARRVRKNMPSIEAIVKARLSLLDELGIPDYVAHEMCWACSTGMSSPVRAHVVGDAKNGENEPSNFFLLCNACHLEQPDAARPDQQVSWLKMVRETGRRTESIAVGFRRLTGADVKQWFDSLRERFGVDYPDSLTRRITREIQRDRVSSFRVSNMVAGLASEYEKDQLELGKWPTGRGVLV